MPLHTIYQPMSDTMSCGQENTRAEGLPLAGSRVAAGFPSPADDYIERHLDLNEKLIRHPSATFMMSVEGDSMVNAGIQDGDLLIVDRAVPPEPGRIVIAAVNGELTVKRLIFWQGGYWLQPENPAYRAMPLDESNDCFIWGVVAHIIHSCL